MILSCENLSFSYGTHEVLREVRFGVEKGEFLSLLGPNGVGKSTLFRCILGTLTDYRGSVFVEGQEIRTLSQRERAQRIAYIPQTHRPTFGYTVMDTVLMGTTRTLSPFAPPRQAQVDMDIDTMNALDARCPSESASGCNVPCLGHGFRIRQSACSALVDTSKSQTPLSWHPYMCEHEGTNVKII